jgi:hypothetical protein
MTTRIINRNGKLVFEVMAIMIECIIDRIEEPQFEEVFKDTIYLKEMQYPINGRKFRLVGLGGEVQDAFFKTYGMDMLLLKTIEDVKQTLEQIIITMNYQVGIYKIVQ